MIVWAVGHCWWRILLGCSIFLFLGLAPTHSLAQSRCNITIASHADLNEAQVFVDRLDDALQAEIRQSPNKIYAVIVPSNGQASGRSFMRDLKRADKIPADSYCILGDVLGPDLAVSTQSDCPSSYKMGHQRGLSIGGSGSFV